LDPSHDHIILHVNALVSILSFGAFLSVVLYLLDTLRRGLTLSVVFVVIVSEVYHVEEVILLPSVLLRGTLLLVGLSDGARARDLDLRGRVQGVVLGLTAKRRQLSALGLRLIRAIIGSFFGPNEIVRVLIYQPFPLEEVLPPRLAIWIVN
jgi:hypothetical protein